MMFTMPVYDMMLLPGVTFYFKNDIFQQMGSQDAKTGDDVLFLMQRSDKDRKDLTAEDFYPVGISGKLDSQDSEGNIRIRTLARVDVSDLEMTEDGVLANASIRPETEDISAEEEKEIFERVKNVLLNYTASSSGARWSELHSSLEKSGRDALCSFRLCPHSLGG